MDQNTQYTEVVIKTDTAFLRFVKKHGITVSLLLIGLNFLNNRLSKAELRIPILEKRISSLEKKLDDCYDSRLAYSNYPTKIPKKKPTQNFPSGNKFILITSKKNKNDNTFL